MNSVGPPHKRDMKTVERGDLWKGRIWDGVGVEKRMWVKLTYYIDV